MEFSWWHLLVGFFFSNGWPHYLAGVGGKRFRSPLGPNSSPRVNLVWGLINFVLGTAVIAWQGLTPPWQTFLISYWVVVAMFGFGWGHFKGEDY